MENSWAHKTLGELFVFKNGLNKGKEYFGYGTPIINYMDVYKHPAIKKKYVQGRVTLSHQELDRFRVLKGDVFFTRTSETPEEVGMSATLLEDIPNCSFSGFVLRARPLTDLLIPEYCVYAFTAKEIRASIIKNCTYTTRALTNGRVLASLKLPIPSFSEQQRIASALSDADALVAELDALIEKKRAIMAGTMQELLTGKRRLQGFSGERKETSLSYFGNVTMGQSPSSLFYNDAKDGLPLIQGNADMCNRKSIIRNYTSKITKTCNAGDIIMSVRAPVGAVGIASFDSCIGRGVCAFKRNNFLYYLLLFIEDDWSKLSVGSTFESVNGNHIRNFEVTIPSSLAEQRAIASILSDMDAEIAELEAKRDKYKEVRQGMMQQLLTGKIRLI